MTFRMRRTASRCNARRRMALMPGRREAAATLAAPGASAYLRGATGEARNFPGALPLKADTELKAEPYPSEGQEEMDFHPSLPRRPRGPIPPRHRGLWIVGRISAA